MLFIQFFIFVSPPFSRASSLSPKIWSDICNCYTHIRTTCAEQSEPHNTTWISESYRGEAFLYAYTHHCTSRNNDWKNLHLVVFLRMNTVRSRRDPGWGNKSNPLRAITCAALPRLWGLPSPPLLLSEEDLTDSLIPHGVPLRNF